MPKPAFDRNLAQKPRKAARLRVAHRTMLPDEIRPEDVGGRSATEKLLPERPQEALEVARLNPEAAAREVESLIRTALREEHGLRRLDALDFLLAAVVAHPGLRAQVAHPYLHTAQCCHGWRAERIIAFRSEHLAAFDLPLAHQLLAGRQPNRFVNKARQTLSSQFDQSKCRQP